jgi:predicted TIM-barrel fold metal-dependent hydrolase
MNEPLEFIDAHHHLWDLEACHYPWLMARGEKRFFGDPTPIQKNYLTTDFLVESQQYRPIASVHIQVGAQDSLAESQWLEQQHDFPQAFVAHCELEAADAVAQIEAHQQFPRLRGMRQIVGRHAEEDGKHGSAALLSNPKWRDGLRQLQDRGLSFDLQMIPPQVDATFAVLRQVEALPVALCHCGSPWDQTRSGLARWRSGLRKLAQLPNVYCKVSGLGMFNSDWNEEDLRDIILPVIDIFSPHRVMFGSNFPVDKLYRSYEDYWRAYELITGDFSPDERHALFQATATEFYRLG